MNETCEYLPDCGRPARWLIRVEIDWRMGQTLAVCDDCRRSLRADVACNVPRGATIEGEVPIPALPE